MFVGRETELALLAERLGDGKLVAVLGEAGVGKTTLVWAAVERGGWRLVEAGGLATLSWIPYLPLTRAFGHEFEGDAAHVAATVEAELGDAVLVMDDLQWADALTASLVPLLAGRIRLVAALRRGDSGTPATLEAVTAAGAELLPLEPLPANEAAALARALHPGLSETATRRLVERSGGNPFLVEQLGATGEPTESLRLAIAARVRELTVEGRESLAMLALLGRPADAQLVGAGAAEIVAAGLATADGELSIRHSLLAEAATETLSDDERRRAHARIAAMVEDPGEGARHHAAAGERELALERALLAAERASTRGERAAHLGVAAANAEGERSVGLRFEAARALVAMTDYADAFELVAVLHPDDADGAAEAALLRSQCHFGLLELDEAERELAAALAAASTHVPLQLRLFAMRARVASRGGRFEEMIAICEEGVRLAAAGGDAAEASELYSSLGYARELLGLPGALEAQERALGLARRAGDAERELNVLNNLAFGLLLEGKPSAADAVVLKAIQQARSLHLLSHERRFRGWHAGVAWHLGNPALAAAESEALLEKALSPLGREFAEVYWWLAMVDLGHGEIVRPHIEGRLASAPADESGSGDVLWALAEVELAAGRPDAAERATVAYAERYQRALPFLEVLRAWAIFEQGKVPKTWHGTVPRLAEGAEVEVEALALRARGDADGAAAAFDRAAARWEDRHVRGWLRCRWAAADSLRAAGRADEARQRLLLLESEVEQRQMNVLLRRIQRSLRLTGVYRAAARTSAGVLTGREAEVLALVAEGWTNAEIARRLGIGRPSVVRLIRSASTKLGVRTRTQAAAIVAGE